MLLELFVFGGLLWWILVVFASILIIWSLEEEHGAWATTAVVGTILLWQFFGDLQLQDISFGSIWDILGLVAGYVGVGITWGVIKWIFFVGKKKEEYEDLKREWLEDQGVYGTKVVPDKLKKEFKYYLSKNPNWIETRGAKVLNIKPRAHKNKSRIIRWMAYWPWSMLWSLLDDVWHKIFRWAQSRVSHLMNAISDWQFKGVEDDFEVESSTQIDENKETVSK